MTHHEPGDSRLSRDPGGACDRCSDVQPAEGRQAEIGAGRRRDDNRGLVWVIGAFVICPCHLPLTLGLAATLLGGTAAGAALRGHPFVAGTVISATWLVATWHGFRLMRSAERTAATPVSGEGSQTRDARRVSA